MGFTHALYPHGQTNDPLAMALLSAASAFFFAFAVTCCSAAPGDRPAGPLKAAPKVFLHKWCQLAHKRVAGTWLAVGCGFFMTAKYELVDSAYMPLSSYGPVTLSLLSWFVILFQRISAALLRQQT